MNSLCNICNKMFYLNKNNSEWKPGSISGISTPLIPIQKVGKLTRERALNMN